MKFNPSITTSALHLKSKMDSELITFVITYSIVSVIVVVVVFYLFIF